MAPLIAVERAGVTIGGVKALDGVTFSCDDGRIVGVVGPSGAGKSALFDAVCGRHPLSAGSIAVNGAAIAGLAPHRIARLGLARTYATDRLFGRMTAFENVLAGTLLSAEPERSRRTVAAAVLDALSLADGSRFVGGLASGERRRVALGRALATGARSLLLEEPFLSLDAAERELVASAVRAAAKRGAAVVIAARDVDACAGLCDSVIVLHAGKPIAAGTFEGVVADIDVRDAYLGVEWRQ